MTHDTEFERLAAARSATRAQYPALFERVSEILHRHDPMGITTGDPNEYEAEAGTIIPRLRLAYDAGDVETIIGQEMAFWYGDAMAPPEEGFGPTAREVWAAWAENPNP